MPDSIEEKINKCHQQVLLQGDIEDASDFVEKLEKVKTLSQEEKLNCQLLKAEIYRELGKYDESFKIAELVLHEAKNVGNIFLTVRAVHIRWESQIHLGVFLENEERHVSLINYIENLIKSVKQIPLNAIEKSKAILYEMKGYAYQAKGHYDLALENFKKSLEVIERYEYFPGAAKAVILYKIGANYFQRGELELSFEFLNKCLELSKGSNAETIKFFYGSSIFRIGQIFYQKGDLDKSIIYLEKAFNILEQLNDPDLRSAIYFAIISVLITKGSLEEAKQYLQHLYQYYEEFKYHYDIIWYKLSNVLLLKNSIRIRDLSEAESILKELIEQHDEIVKTDERGIGSPAFTETLLQLCDIYLKELEMTQSMEIIDDILPLLKRLLEESERTNRFPVLAQTFLLQGKLSLLQMNMGDARKFLTQAQQIAEEHGLQLLAREISSEHDKFLDMVKGLQQYERKKVPVVERLNMASLDVILDQMQGRRALNPPELVSEEPIFLLIIGQDGISYFNHSFVDNWNFDDIFSSFMSAFNKFSSEIFEKSIDRIKIDENVILVKPVDSYLVCYVIRGQSYPALQKLTRFSDAIKWNTEISDALKKSIQTGEVLDINNPASLGTVVNEIFNN
ncbi:MAG: tetratricopeptide repeat protein [Candidatus Thorarchaeota archaeon]